MCTTYSALVMNALCSNKTFHVFVLKHLTWEPAGEVLIPLAPFLRSHEGAEATDFVEQKSKRKTSS